MKALLFSSFLLITFFAETTMAQTKVAGEYHLVGIHDLAAGLRLTEQGSFEFFYIYGAVDRFAQGTYTVEGNVIKLKSAKEAGKDFTVKKAGKRPGGYTIKVLDSNPMLAQYVKCIVVNGKEKNVEFMNSKGELHLSTSHAERIYLQHELYPDIATEIKNESNDNSYFEVTLNPSLQQVSFKGIDFKIEDQALTCFPNYFMPFDRIKFVKN
ncbi:MAG: hypothetical protein U0X91_17770 [Spirosomataceae bacterium]